MRCHHFESGECRSCTLLDLPRARQVAEGRERVETLLAPFLATGAAWQAPIVGAESGFRARGKMAVGGTAQEPVLGLPGQALTADLCDCPLYPDGVEAVLEGAKALIRRAQVPPYDVARRRGELKNVLVTASPDGEHLLRLVLRSEKALGRIREHLPAMLAAHPSVIAVTANIHPDHTTRVEGEQEIPLAGASSIAVRTGDVTLFARPQSFLQTHTGVAGDLYRQGAAWISEILQERTAADTPAGEASADPENPENPESRANPASPAAVPAPRIWDLYCGLGGFALHVARALPSARVTGVEVSAQAIDGARESAAAQRLPATFLADDATAWAIREAAGEDGPPDVVVVNPPRRGIGPELAAWLERSGVRDIVYSSCNPTTLATDLAAMPSVRVTAGRFVDMFPHTEHAEVIVRLRRTSTT
ncbi:methyltransferase domain-containing protein [Brachybacterium alimentarium]|uniref:23S rRNA (Uracil(747)-C(5))-methyltransferase n=1 Tax=Brachybacterium alimentarium TaxID=47845 RepID=A0A2A3YMJ5_9MICO|nr:methyltransferase domain-containing protein [Brachybacterium alimentarium]PCC40524.1 23S rRNA (uracil(747)-C(5))-methyltransferase [Brachybacterium alimentarium]RCS66010.1 methyltransferase domain-containing protein [Brachybacterium alimentarium]RCS77824.1 methyltransferase domain-containing protein [Brachybacterium alimentarium]RCS92558.1 methyltransferase domain-containing protein [Brachybacterium alimentarium]